MGRNGRALGATVYGDPLEVFLIHRRLVVCVVVASIGLASCSSEADDDEGSTSSSTSASSTTAPTSPPSTTATTTTTQDIAESSPVLIAFDGNTCTVTGGPLEAGLADISLLNTSPASADALLLLLTASLTLDDVADDVAAGLYNDFNPGASLEDGPASEAGGAVFSIMPEGMSEPLTKTINAKSGTWAVVCVQMSTSMAYMGTDVIEVP